MRVTPMRLVKALALALCLGGAHGTDLSGFSQRVRDLVAKMSLKDKAGQMTELDVAIAMNWATGTLDEYKVRQLIRDYRLGSFLNSPMAGDNPGIWSAADWRKNMRIIQRIAEEEGVPPLIHGLDSVHGANYVKDAVMFPQQIGVGATFNPTYAREMGRVTARDTMAGGVQWIYGPILDLGVNSRWPRHYETFSEDPHLVAVMGAEVISGMQNFTHDGLKAAACMKHFIAYSATSTGQDQAPVLLDKRDVENYYLTPYRAAVKAGIRTAMESYQEISGVPMVSSREYLKDLLRYELNFQGFLVTDYGEVNGLHGEHGITADYKEAVRLAMADTSIDMSMTAWDADFATHLVALVEEGKVPQGRLDESVARILQTKEDLGLLDRPYALLGDDNPLDKQVGSAEDKAIALDAIRESVTLLKNEHGLLPLDGKRKYNILVVGPTADSLAYQCGGWSIHWHGPVNSGEIPYGTTLLQGIKQLAGKGSTVDYLQGTDTEGKWVTDRDQLADRARRADVIVVGVGERNYAEASANIPDLVLPAGQHDLVTHLAASSSAPIVTVLFEGRPRLLGPIPSLSDAVIHGYLPGPDGGLGVAEILFGQVNPSGRLPFTYPRHQNGPTLTYYRKQRQRDYDVEWPFGAGLSYTSFAYENARLSRATTDEHTPVTLTVTVRNTGRRSGKHTVLLFGSDVVRRVSPEVKMLKQFAKTRELAPGASQEVTLTIDPKEDLSFYGVERHRVLEGGDWLFGLGEQVDCRKSPQECLKLTVELSADYDPLCDAACEAFGRVHGACAHYWPRASQAGDGEVKTLAGGADFASCRRLCRQQGDWRWNMVDCLREVVVEKEELCSKVSTLCRNPFA